MRRGSARRLAAALALAGGAHAAAWMALHDHHLDVPDLREADLDGVDEAMTSGPTRDEVTMVALVSLPADGSQLAVPEIPLEALRGPADDQGARTHPNPNAKQEIAGEDAASRGGGGEAGASQFTGRQDQTTDVPIHHEQWNGKDSYQSAHDRTAKTAKSPEAIRQTEADDIGDRAAAERVASAGTPRASSGAAETGQGPATTAPIGAPAPTGTAQAGTTTPAAHDGAIRSSPTAPQVLDRGATSTDVPAHGPVATDNTTTAAASRDAKPGPFEITPPASGGTARTGVSGAPAPGQLAKGSGTGTASTPWGVKRGRRDLGVVADAQDPYFRVLYAKLSRLVVYPRNLAIELRSGRPIAEVTLRADGAISRPAIAVPSGQAEFDKELVRAIAAVKRLPPPPAALLDGKTEIKVRVEWVFDPGILR